jgi:hypothetical protein
VTAVDALKELRFIAGLYVPEQGSCRGIETEDFPRGDVNCDGGVTALDALQILRFVAGLPVSQVEPCPDLGHR